MSAVSTFGGMFALTNVPRSDCNALDNKTLDFSHSLTIPYL